MLLSFFEICLGENLQAFFAGSYPKVCEIDLFVHMQATCDILKAVRITI